MARTKKYTAEELQKAQRVFNLMVEASKQDFAKRFTSPIERNRFDSADDAIENINIDLYETVYNEWTDDNIYPLNMSAYNKVVTDWYNNK